MKKLVLTTLVVGAMAGSLWAQGTVALPLQTTRYIQYTTDGTTLTRVPAGSPATVGSYGSLNVAVYYAASGTASPFTTTTASLLPVAWHESTEVLHNLYGAGVNLAQTFTLPTVAGRAGAEVMVVGWTGNFADWNTAFAANTGTSGLFAWTGSALSGGTLAWANGTGDPNFSPPDVPTALTVGAGGYNGLVLQMVAIPEPSTFALVGLGAAALLIFRRRK